MWLPYTLRKMDHAFLMGRKAKWGELTERPSEIFRRHFVVAPFPEENVERVVAEVGIEPIVFGSDFPHGEGLAYPVGVRRCAAEVVHRRREARHHARQPRALPPRRLTVNVGVYFDLRNAPSWPQDPARLYGFTLELCEEAERLGAHSVWLSEHHLFDDGYLPQPLTFAAAVAARTTRVRIGTAVLLAPLHDAVEIAEQVAVVDLVSNGRVELGLGAGYRVPEFELFGRRSGRALPDHRHAGR